KETRQAEATSSLHSPQSIFWRLVYTFSANTRGASIPASHTCWHSLTDPMRKYLRYCLATRNSSPCSRLMLEGKVVEGNHEKLVSKEVFLMVNGLLKENPQGYKINEENSEIPL